MSREKVYIDVDDYGNILACASTPVNDSELYVMVENPDDLYKYMTAYKYVAGGLIFDNRKKQRMIDEDNDEELEISMLNDRVKALESALLDIILEGDSND